MNQNIWSYIHIQKPTWSHTPLNTSYDNCQEGGLVEYFKQNSKVAYGAITSSFANTIAHNVTKYAATTAKDAQ